MPDAVIVDAVRTPVGRRGGVLSAVHPTDLSAAVLNALTERTGIDPATVEDVQWGCVSQVGDQSSNVGRYSLLAAGWPEHVPAVTVNRACGSSQQALDHAAWAVMAGQMELAVAGGVESMSRVPLAAARASGEPYGPAAKQRYGVEVFDQLRGAELIARQWQLNRAQVDEFSLRSHQLALAAIDSGAVAAAIAPVRSPAGLVQWDENPRPALSLAALATARPLGDADGVHRAGNAAPFADAAAALVVTTPERARQLGLRPSVRYRAAATIGADPVTGLTAVIPATELVLKKAGLTIEDIGAYEISEAFASVPLAWLADTKADPDAVNAWGGAIAWGHPLGASGAMLMTHLIGRMRAGGIRYGMQAMCEGGGLANATIVELFP